MCADQSTPLLPLFSVLLLPEPPYFTREYTVGMALLPWMCQYFKVLAPHRTWPFPFLFYFPHNLPSKGLVSHFASYPYSSFCHFLVPTHPASFTSPYTHISSFPHTSTSPLFSFNITPLRHHHFMNRISSRPHYCNSLSTPHYCYAFISFLLPLSHSLTILSLQSSPTTATTTITTFLLPILPHSLQLPLLHPGPTKCLWRQYVSALLMR